MKTVKGAFRGRMESYWLTALHEAQTAAPAATSLPLEMRRALHTKIARF